MKQSYKKFFIIGALALVGFSACKKDKKTTASADASTSLTASTADIQLSSGNSTGTADSFNWSAVSYDFSANVNYSLQFDISGDFPKPALKVIGVNILQKSYTVAEINTIAKGLTLTAGNAGKLYLRVKSDLNQYTGVASTAKSVYSNVIVLNVTPY